MGVWGLGFPKVKYTAGTLRGLGLSVSGLG